MIARPSRVIVLSNDVVPGMGMPVAAPGLRAYGLALGLRSHGYNVQTVVDRGPQSRVWSADVPAPSQPGVMSLQPQRFMEYIESLAPVTVVTTNSNQVEWLRAHKKVRYVVDFFAPKMLELAHQRGDDYPHDELAILRERKLRSIDLADGFIINGRKKHPYFVAWLLQGGRDLRSLPLEIVNMPMPGHFADRSDNEVPKLGMAGYLQGWSKPASWIRSALRLVDEGKASLEVLAPTHWGQARAELASPELDEVLAHPGVTVHGAMQFPEYQDFIAGLDVVLDVFDHSLEREYAMVTRSVSALSCGRPIVHPNFTEVSPIVEEFDAGWLLASSDDGEVDGVLREIVDDRDELRRRTQNTRVAWERTFEPGVATAPLDRVIRSVWD